MTTPNTPDTPPPLTPPYAQVHFWAVIVASVISLLVGLNLVGPDFAKSHEDLVNAVALLASVLGPSLYAVARGISQHGHQVAQAQVLAAKLNTQAMYGPPAGPGKRRATGDA